MEPVTLPVKWINPTDDCNFYNWHYTTISWFTKTLLQQKIWNQRHPCLSIRPKPKFRPKIIVRWGNKTFSWVYGVCIPAYTGNHYVEAKIKKKRKQTLVISFF